MTAWRTLVADGCEWQVRAVPRAAEGGADDVEADVLEFRTAEGTRPARRLAVSLGALKEMDDAALRAAYLQARPIGGDYYGRPGKKMSDMP
jgi:hypothetical protein